MSPTDLPLAPLALEGVPTPSLGSRDQFPALVFDSFLAHAAISPSCIASTRAAEQCLQDIARSGAAVFPRWMAQRDRLRCSIAGMLGTTSKLVALSPGCTKGITDVALALPWKTGEVLLTFEGEFPANVIPWQQAARLASGQVKFLQLPSATQAGVRERILSVTSDAIVSAKNTRHPVRYLAVSAVEFQTGLRLPLRELGELCREHEVRFFVDGIQACGVLPLSVSEIHADAFFTGAHKWLLSPEGTGFFTLSEALVKELTPATAGWLSYEESEQFLFQGKGHLKYDRSLRAGAAVFEGSTSNSAGFAALEGGVDVCRTLGAQSIYDHVQTLHNSLVPIFESRGFTSLRPVDEGLRSCLLSFDAPAHVNVTLLAVALRERGVMISIPDGRVRLAPHFGNNLEEMPIVEHALDQALASLA